MRVWRFFFALIYLFLVGCNSPTITPDRQTPVFATANYENLDCYQLKDELQKLEVIIRQLSGVTNEPRYILHTEIPFIGTGDSMGAVQLLKARAEKNAVQMAFENKNCRSSAN